MQERNPRRRMWGTWHLAAAMALLPALGCAPAGTDDPGHRHPAGTPLRIQDPARLCVGVTAGDAAQEFDQVVTPFLLPDGRLVVPLAGPREIRLFDVEGRHLASLGRTGDGPGEFASLHSAWARGDTIEAFDDRRLRITRFLPGGQVEVVSLSRIPSAQSAVPGGPSFGWVLTGVAEAGANSRDQVALHRFSLDGSYLGEMGRVDGMARHRVPGFSGPDPLSPRPVVALAGDTIYVGETLTPRLRVYAGDGTLEGEVTWTPGGTVPAGEAYQAVVEAALERATPERADATRQRLEAFPRAAAVSVFWGVIVDAAGFIWIRPFDPSQHALEFGGYRSPGVGGDWLLLAPDGTATSSIVVPSQLEPVSITTDAVVGIRRDDLGVESVCVHGLERRGNGGA